MQIKKDLEIAGKKKIPGLQLLHYDGLHIPLPDCSPDKIVSSLVFHHIPAAGKKTILRELFRVATQGGELHIADVGKAVTLFTKVVLVFLAGWMARKILGLTVKGYFQNSSRKPDLHM